MTDRTETPIQSPANIAFTLQTHSSAGKNKWPKRVIVLLVVLGSLFLAFGRDSGNASKTTFETAKVTRGDLHVTVAAAGTLEPTNVVTIGSEVSGTISDVFADINDTVKKGQTLVKIDTSTLEDTLEKSKAALAAAQASVAQAEATLKEEQANLSRQRELARLSNNRLPSKADLDTAEAAVTRAEANLASAKASVIQAEATVRSNETNLDKANIKSPIDGIVLSRDIEPGQTVAASLSAPDLMEIAEDLTKMKLQVDVDEADVGQVKEGQSATFTVDAWPNRTYPATISRVSFGSTTTDNVVSYETTLLVDNPDLSLRPGMTASAIINTNSRTNILLVPNAALRFTPPEQKEEKESSSILSSLMPRPPHQQRRQPTPESKEGQTKTIWTLDSEGIPSPLTVVVGATNGSMTEVSGDDLHEGMLTITGSVTLSGE